MKVIKIKEEFANDYITRKAGERLRELIIRELEKENIIIVDFIDIVVASTSFFDEAFAKLADSAFDRQVLEKNIVINNLDYRDKKTLVKLSQRRFPKYNRPKW